MIKSKNQDKNSKNPWIVPVIFFTHQEQKQTVSIFQIAKSLSLTKLYLLGMQIIQNKIDASQTKS